MKITKIFFSLLLITSLSLAVAPQQAHAFTLFGIKFFEPKATPTPTPKPTITPTPAPTQVAQPTDENGQVLGDHQNLPSTGPRENVAIILAIIAGAFIARKYWQVSHKL